MLVKPLQGFGSGGGGGGGGGGDLTSIPDGSVGSPSLMFDGDTNTGWYQPVANQWAFTVGGTQKFVAYSAGLYLTGGSFLFANNQHAKMASDCYLSWASGVTPGVSEDLYIERQGAGALEVNASAGGGGDGDLYLDRLLVGAGATATPSITFAGDPDTGWNNNAANQIQLAMGGSRIATYTGTFVQYDHDLYVQGTLYAQGVHSGAAMAFETNTAVAASPHAVSANDSNTWFTNRNASAKTYHDLPAGYNGAPYFTFLSDESTGLYRGVRIDSDGSTPITIAGQTSAGGYIETEDSESFCTVYRSSRGWVADYHGNWGLDGTPLGCVRPTGNDSVLEVQGGLDGTAGAGLQFIEFGTAPTAPAANKAILFAEDNGSGKTRLVVRFNSGADVVLATQA